VSENANKLIDELIDRAIGYTQGRTNGEEELDDTTNTLKKYIEELEIENTGLETMLKRAWTWGI